MQGFEYRQKKKICLFIVLLLVACETSCDVREKLSEPQPLAIRLIFPRYGKEKVFYAFAAEDSFYLVMKNTGSKPLKFYSGLAHHGYKNVTFVIYGPQKERYFPHAVEREMGTETDFSFYLLPGEEFVHRISPISKNWNGFPDCMSRPMRMTIQAVYCQNISKDTAAFNWSGVVKSVPIEVDVMIGKKEA